MFYHINTVMTSIYSTSPTAAAICVVPPASARPAPRRDAHAVLPKGGTNPLGLGGGDQEGSHLLEEARQLISNSWATGYYVFFLRFML